MTYFYTVEDTDKRLQYAKQYLEANGFISAKTPEKADFILMGINPKDFISYTSKPVFAGNVSACNVYDYTKLEAFALENAYLTAEGALALAVNESKRSLVNSKILILGYGRIAKALCSYLKAFSKEITICARNENQLLSASLNGFNTINFDELKIRNDYDFVFNTVAHPVINEFELRALKKDCLVIDLASFPGGVDKMFARALNINLIEARGLPARFSPETAGEVVAKAVISMIKGGLVGK